MPLSRRYLAISHVHVDLVSPLLASRDGHMHLLTAVVRTTRWLKMMPLRSIAAGDCSEARVTRRVSQFGVPQYVTSNHGPQFMSKVWAALCQRLGIKHNISTALNS
jgi:hypothetical protein